jgi:ATP-dependent Clp protease ATP-binding subunit ClpC
LKSTVEEAMKKLFNPEFLNRVDETIVFRSLEREDILQIIDIELKDLYKNMHDNKMVLTLDQSAKNFLVDKGFDQKYGARPLKRAIQKYVEDPLAEEILRGSFKEGAKIVAKNFENTEHIVFVDEESDIDISDKEKESAGSEEN